ncbi:FAD-binding domain-containing protein [Penicillium brevicompactum]|uniref:FAD-binding domain-containing protein n=1 Tax=Penicillium brevicompactum TaxID=5074 RepID=A0A9W9UIS1_PENBR|nr:FAD-binding domain-containing protein [Penicillium brevicompactum]
MMERLIDFLDQHPHIPYSTPSSSEFNTLRPGYVIDSTTPAIILRPRTADDVAGLISILKTNSLHFAIRVGGHDMFGRYQAESAVTIDLREIAYIHVDREARTARIGGGVIVSDLLSVLDQYGMVVPHPIISSVGFVGWATHGGYGLMSSEYGLGVDQILQAKVVGADATVCNANDEMLAVIRGGGGTLGVIVELTIKIYPLAQLLAGFILYDSNDLPAAIKRYNDAYRQQKATLPKELNLFQSVMNGPVGKGFGVIFVWASSDLDAGQTWLSRVSSWSPVSLSTVSSTTMAAFNETTKAIAPQAAFGKSLTLSFKDLTSESSHYLGYARAAGVCPKAYNGHLNCRPYPHFVMELLPTVRDAALLDAALAWAEDLYKDLVSTDPDNKLISTYLPLTEPDRVNMQGIYGDKYQLLKLIKHKYDPDNVFARALAQV